MTWKERLGSIVYDSILLVMKGMAHAMASSKPKYKSWVEGQNGLIQRIKDDFKDQSDQAWIWFHCASLGEFEQGRPLIEKIKAETKYRIVLTFFSPSGYEIRKNYTGADKIYYLPMDTYRNAKAFVESIQPKMVFFVKYEYWFYYLYHLSSRKIPVYLISCFFRPNQSFFQWYGSFFTQFINKFDYFFVQDDRTSELLSSIGFKNIEVTGDTRFDRVVQISQSPKAIPVIETFKGSSKLVVIGSAWNSCVDHWLPFLHDLPKNTQVVLVPHEPDAAHLGFIQKQLQIPYVLFSRFESTFTHQKVLVVDNIGMLSSIYAYADVAYVGAGFEVGLHNVLEAAVYGIPVVVGPKISKSKEAIDLEKLGGLLTVAGKEALKETVTRLLENDEERQSRGKISKTYVWDNRGSTDKIFAKTIRS